MIFCFKKCNICYYCCIAQWWFLIVHLSLRELYIRLKISNENNLWFINKFTFRSFGTINFDAVYGNLLPTLWQLQNKKRFGISTITIRINEVESKKIPLFDMANFSVQTFVLGKQALQIGKGWVDSLSRRLIYFSIIEIHVQFGQY